MSEDKVLNFLVVDSNHNNALFWEMAISSAWSDAKVATCQQGFDALEQAKTTKFDFMVASWDLEPMSGMVLMQKLKEMHRYKNVPYLLFSQVLTKDDVALAKDFGITNYLIRPFERDRCIENIKAMLDAETNLDANSRSLRKVDDWIQEGKINEALKLITPLLEKKGDHKLRAWVLNGDLWSRADKPDKAESSYRNALKIEADHAPALAGLGKVLVKLKRFEEGLAMLERVHEKSPRNLMRMVALGGAYVDAGDLEKAEGMYRKTQALDADNPDAQAGLGKVDFSKGNFDNAARLFRESGRGDELASYFNTMAISQVSKGRFKDGIDIYRNALKVLPERAKFHLIEFNIGLAFRKAGAFGEATDAFARSLSENPLYEKAHAALIASTAEAKKSAQAFDQALCTGALAKAKASKESPAEKKAS